MKLFEMLASAYKTFETLNFCLFLFRIDKPFFLFDIHCVKLYTCTILAKKKCIQSEYINLLIYIGLHYRIDSKKKVDLFYLVGKKIKRTQYISARYLFLLYMALMHSDKQNHCEIHIYSSSSWRIFLLNNSTYHLIFQHLLLLDFVNYNITINCQV